MPARYSAAVFESVDVTRDIVYREARDFTGKNVKLLLDLYEPRGDRAELRPAIIWVHGGAFVTGNKSWGIEKELATAMARRGYLCLSIDYRLRTAPVADWPGTFRDATDDAAAALDWLAANARRYRVDMTHVAYGGHSAGGQTVANLCYREPLRLARWKKGSVFAVIPLSGAALYMGGVTKGDPPCLLIQGTADEIVSFEESRTLAARLSDAVVYNVLHPLLGTGHDLMANFEEVVSTITAFLDPLLTGRIEAASTR
jgi:acetyl esterase/lipase